MNTIKSDTRWLYRVTQAMASPFVLVPLAPVIIACWVARWLHQQ